MELKQALLHRRTVQSYKAAPVPRHVLDEALEAANFAPNHKLTFPWRFTILGPATREKIAALAVELKGSKAPLTEDKKRSIRGKFLNPGLLIAVGCLRSSDPVRAKEDYAAVACAIQNLMLTFHAHGFGSMWGTGAASRHEQTYQILGVDPQREEIVGFLYAGVAEKPPVAPPRPPWRDFVRELA